MVSSIYRSEGFFFKNAGKRPCDDAYSLIAKHERSRAAPEMNRASESPAGRQRPYGSRPIRRVSAHRPRAGHRP